MQANSSFIQDKFGCTCHGCGDRYTVDVLVPDVLWAKIRPQVSECDYDGMLCGKCIFERIEMIMGFGAFEVNYK